MIECHVCVWAINLEVAQAVQWLESPVEGTPSADFSESKLPVRGRQSSEKPRCDDRDQSFTGTIGTNEQ